MRPVFLAKKYTATPKASKKMICGTKDISEMGFVRFKPNQKQSKMKEGLLRDVLVLSTEKKKRQRMHHFF